MKKVFLAAMILTFIGMYSLKAEAFPFGKKKAAPATNTTAKEKVSEVAAQQAPVAPEAAPQAEAPQAATPAPQAATPAPQMSKAQLDVLEARRKVMDKKRSELNNTEWQIEILGVSGKEKKEKGTLTFKNNRISVSNFGKFEFPATNYSITVQKDGLTIWETMQVSETAGTAFWRGEIDSDMKNMKGSLSHHIDENTTNDYSFASTGKKIIPQQAQQK